MAVFDCPDIAHKIKNNFGDSEITQGDLLPDAVLHTDVPQRGCSCGHVSASVGSSAMLL